MEEEHVKTSINQKQSKGMGLLSVIFITFLISGATAIISLYYYHKNYALKVISVDIAGFVESQKESFVSGKVDEKWIIRKREELTHYLKKIPQNTLLITSDVVLSDYPVDNNIPAIRFNSKTERWVITYVEK